MQSKLKRASEVPLFLHWWKIDLLCKYQVGDRVLVKLSGGVKAVIETTNGVRLQVSFGEETARI